MFAICLTINQFRLGQICNTFCMFPTTDILISVYVHAFTYLCPNLIWGSANFCSQKIPLRSVMKPFRFMTDIPSGEWFVWHIRVDIYANNLNDSRHNFVIGPSSLFCMDVCDHIINVFPVHSLNKRFLILILIDIRLRNLVSAKVLTLINRHLISYNFHTYSQFEVYTEYRQDQFHTCMILICVNFKCWSKM